MVHPRVRLRAGVDEPHRPRRDADARGLRRLRRKCAGAGNSGDRLGACRPRAAIRRSSMPECTTSGRCSALPACPYADVVHTAVRSLGLSEVAEFNPDEKIIEDLLAPERPLASITLQGFADETSRDSTAPGGGSVAALAGALGAALAAMVANLPHPKEDFSGVRDELEAIAVRGQELKQAMLDAIDDDTWAFQKVMEANKAPEEDSRGGSTRGHDRRRSGATEGHRDVPRDRRPVPAGPGGRHGGLGIGCRRRRHHGPICSRRRSDERAHQPPGHGGRRRGRRHAGAGRRRPREHRGRSSRLVPRSGGDWGGSGGRPILQEARSNGHHTASCWRRIVVPFYFALGAVLKLMDTSATHLPAALVKWVGAFDINLMYVFRLSIAGELAVAGVMVLVPRLARPVGLFLLGVFLPILIGDLALGASSCGCFGAVQVPPWVTLVIDGGLFLGLWWFGRQAPSLALKKSCRHCRSYWPDCGWWPAS